MMTTNDLRSNRYQLLDRILATRKQIIADVEIAKQQELEALLRSVQDQCKQLTGHNFIGNRCTACGVHQSY